jgi:glycosyltransferase involved in cell wall biosynthesis
MIPRNPEVRALSVFFPCYNDADSIGGMVTGARAALVDSVDDFEIVVVDDGSRDDSLRVLRALSATVPELRIVEHEVNRGYGGALLSGFAACTRQWVFYTDGDAQYDPGELVRCIDAATADIDIVQGYKLGRGDPWYRKVIGRVYHHVVRALFGLRVRDVDCDFRLIRRELVERVELTSTSGVICVEMMRRFQDVGARFTEVGVSHHFRPHGRSQFFRVSAIARSARQLAGLWWRIVVRGPRRAGPAATATGSVPGVSAPDRRP